MKHRRNFARACANGTPPPILSIGKSGWNGGSDATRLILCTANSY